MPVSLDANPSPSVRFYEFEPFRIDVQRRQLLRQSEPVLLPPKALETLLALVERRGRVVDKEELMGLLWPDTVVEEANLTQSVFMARKALGETSGEQRFIATAPRRGYRFVADVHEVPTSAVVDAPLGPVPRAGEGALAAPRPISTRPRLVATVSIILVLVALVMAAWRLSGHRPVAAGPIRSLAVLPLHDLSTVAGEEYFADGLTDALITDLASISALRTVSYQSVTRYKGSRKAMPEIARELGVDGVIEGSVVRSGGKLRLTVQLVHGASDRHVWAATYDRDLIDTLKLQGELARSVAREIQVTVTEQEQKALSARRPVDPEAYALYLRGRHYWNRRGQEGLQKSIECFEQAVGRDPTLAVAYAGMALAYAPLGFFGYAPPAEARMRMQAAAKKALELDPGLEDAHVAVASIKALYDWDWDGGEKAWRSVLQRSPNNATARLWYGRLLEKRGRADEALAERIRALELDPLALYVNVAVGDTFCFRGQYDRAIELYLRALELDPHFANGLRGLGWAYFMKGMRPQGIAELQKAAEISAGDPSITSWLGHAYGLAGRTADAGRVLRAMKERSRQRYVSPFFLACVHAGLGERDAAFAWLNDAFRQRSPILPEMKGFPLLVPLRTDPRFDELLRRMKLN